RIILKDEKARHQLHEAAALRLQEQLYDLLSRPVETTRELKDLAHITKAITQLGVDLRAPDSPGMVDFKQLLREIQKQMIARKTNPSAAPEVQSAPEAQQQTSLEQS